MGTGPTSSLLAGTHQSHERAISPFDLFHEDVRERDIIIMMTMMNVYILQRSIADIEPHCTAE